jgi:hypothetical protein
MINPRRLAMNLLAWSPGFSRFLGLPTSSAEPAKAGGPNGWACGFMGATRELSVWKILPLIALVLWPLCLRGESAGEALVRAEAAVRAATPRAQADPAHPIFHVTSPAQWVNDPNGPVFYKGVYHLFYQLTPYSDESGIKYWGHARSRDLAQWEHLPIAIAPSNDRGEESIWSGCCTINGDGKPMIFYTSIAQGKSPFDHASQWAATGDADLIHWEKSPANPVLSEASHGGRKFYDWRDPFIFQDSGKTFMVVGGSLNESKGGQAVVNIYEAENAALTRWKYRGVLFQLPDASSWAMSGFCSSRPTAKCNTSPAISTRRLAASVRGRAACWISGRIFTRQTRCWFQMVAGWCGAG